MAAIQASEPAIEDSAAQKRAKAEQDAAVASAAADADADALDDAGDDEEDFLLARLEAAEDDEFVEDE